MGFYDIEWANSVQLTMKQMQRNQLIINRFFYNSVGEYTASPTAIATAWYALWKAAAEPLQHYGLTYEEVQCLQLASPGQSASIFPVGENGSDVATSVPMFFCHYFRVTCVDSRVKKGRKALSGVTEAMIDIDNLASGYTAYAAAFEDFLLAPLIVGDDTFLPVLLSPANTRHTGNVTAALVSATWVGWSTQSSRKLGRGA